mmetsp:Transcript_36363/g.92913  ORF Transcript_36363/g.92913 Transcript_36363/m.92913 type:complete len:226 (+) Transcript_36363:836-1513(+)
MLPGRRGGLLSWRNYREAGPGGGRRSEIERPRRVALLRRPTAAALALGRRQLRRVGGFGRGRACRIITRRERGQTRADIGCAGRIRRRTVVISRCPTNILRLGRILDDGLRGHGISEELVDERRGDVVKHGVQAPGDAWAWLPRLGRGGGGGGGERMYGQGRKCAEQRGLLCCPFVIFGCRTSSPLFPTPPLQGGRPHGAGKPGNTWRWGRAKLLGVLAENVLGA